MYRILCYGDSNTWGYTPGTGARYAPDVRWTGVAQKALGENYLLLEEGLNSRTTVYENRVSPYRNGADYLFPCLMSQKPLDLVVLMLGTNDLRWTNAHGAADGARLLCKHIRLAQHLEESSPVFPNGPRILLIAPPKAHQILASQDCPEKVFHYYEESRHFGRLYEAVARELGLAFLNAADFTQPSPIDGVHLDTESHRRLGMAVAEKIQSLLE